MSGFGAHTMTSAEPSGEGVEPPYYAVIFISERTEMDEDYDETAARMEALARAQSGFLGMNRWYRRYWIRIAKVERE